MAVTVGTGTRAEGSPYSLATRERPYEKPTCVMAAMVARRNSGPRFIIAYSKEARRVLAMNQRGSLGTADQS